jgi:predicted acetyltransferase
VNGPDGRASRLSGPFAFLRLAARAAEGKLVSVSVRDARNSQADREWIEGVYRDYLDDLAPLNTGIFPVLGEVGHREPDQIARWFGDPNAVPLVIVKASERVGFAMVSRPPSGASPPPVDYRMAEFFVARPHRGLGVGRGAVQLILDRFRGRWEIIEYMRNPGAVNFWRRVVSLYTRGNYQERVTNGEVRQVFQSGAKSPAATGR